MEWARRFNRWFDRLSEPKRLLIFVAMVLGPVFAFQTHLVVALVIALVWCVVRFIPPSHPDMSSSQDSGGER